jgi:hypothetical protein
MEGLCLFGEDVNVAEEAGVEPGLDVERRGELLLLERDAFIPRQISAGRLCSESSATARSACA